MALHGNTGLTSPSERLLLYLLALKQFFTFICVLEGVGVQITEQFVVVHPLFLPSGSQKSHSGHQATGALTHLDSLAS